MTRPWCWLSTLRSDHYWPPRKTRFRWLARPCRVGLATHRVATKGFKDATPYPPFLSFAWRNAILRTPRTSGTEGHRTAPPTGPLPTRQSAHVPNPALDRL